MKRTAVAVALLAAAGVAAAAARRQPGAAIAEGETSYSPQTLWAGAVDVGQDFANQVLQLAEEVTVTNTPMPPTPYLATQLAAMRATIQQAEGTDQAGNPYRVCYSYRHTIVSLADHPTVTGEWRGETLPDAMCKAAGFGPGCVSTAAGAYQIVRPTWLRIKRKLQLPDFGPTSQDRACDELLRERGAVVHLERGDFTSAIRAARKEWASLPGADYGQGERTVAWLRDRFTAAGGVVLA